MRRSRTIEYTVIDGNFLRRTTTLSDGTAYTHHCPRGIYEAVAYAMEDGKGHTGSETAETLDLPYSAVDVAFQFMKDRGIIETRHRRRSFGASKCVFEDAMLEFHALRERPESKG